MPKPESEDREIDRELLLATATGNEDLVRAKLRAGANPFATVQTDSGPKNVLLDTLFRSNRKIVAILLKHTTQPGQTIIDLAQPSPSADPKNPEPMNIIQDAFFKSNRDCRILLHDYFVEHNPGKKYSTVINKPFCVPYNDGTFRKETLGHVLLKTFSIRFIASNCQLFKDRQENEPVERAFSRWLHQDRINSNPPDEIYYFGPAEIFEFLYPKEIDLHAVNHDKMTVVALAEHIAQCLQDPQLCESMIQKLLRFLCIKQTGPAYLDDNGGMRISIEASNIYNEQPFNTTLVINITKFLVDLRAAAAAQIAPPTPHLAELQVTVDAHALALTKHTHELKEQDRELKKQKVILDQVQKDVATAFTKLASISQLKYDETCVALESYPFYHLQFITLFDKLESFVRQKKDSMLKVFATNPSNDQLVAAQGLAGVFCIAGAFCPAPFVNIIPAIGQMLVSVGIQMDNARQSKAVFKETLGMRTDDIARCVAIRLVAEAMTTYGDVPDTTITKQFDKINNDLYAKVKAQVNKMFREAFVNPAHLLGYLCETAVKHLKDRNSSSSVPLLDEPMQLFAALADAPKARPALATNTNPRPIVKLPAQKLEADRKSAAAKPAPQKAAPAKTEAKKRCAIM